MKPKLKPRKDFRYRVIICDDEGRYEYDDMDDPRIVPYAALRLLKDLLEREKNESENQSPKGV